MELEKVANSIENKASPDFDRAIEVFFTIYRKC